MNDISFRGIKNPVKTNYYTVGDKREHKHAERTAGDFISRDVGTGQKGWFCLYQLHQAGATVVPAQPTHATFRIGDTGILCH